MTDLTPPQDSSFLCSPFAIFGNSVYTPHPTGIGLNTSFLMTFWCEAFLMKGPTFQFDQRVLRVWVCPNCKRSIRTPGSVTSRTCGCSEPPLQMKLQDQRHAPAFDVASFISPDSPEYDDDENPDGLDEPTAAIMAALLARAEAARPPRETPTAEHFGVTGDEDGLSEFGEGVDDAANDGSRLGTENGETAAPQNSRPSDRRPRFDKNRSDRTRGDRGDRGQRTRPGRNEPPKRPDSLLQRPSESIVASDTTSSDDSKSGNSTSSVSMSSVSTTSDASGGVEGGEHRKSRSRRRRRSGRKPGESGATQDLNALPDSVNSDSSPADSNSTFSGDSDDAGELESGIDGSIDGDAESGGEARAGGPRKRRNRRRGRRRGGAGTDRQQGESSGPAGPPAE